jgi:hypothetical protein
MSERTTPAANNVKIEQKVQRPKSSLVLKQKPIKMKTETTGVKTIKLVPVQSTIEHKPEEPTDDFRQILQA